MKTDSDKFDVETGSTDSHLHPAKFHSSAIDQLNNCRTNVPESEEPVNLDSDAKKNWADKISDLKYLANSLELILNNVYSGIIFCDRANQRAHYKGRRNHGLCYGEARSQRNRGRVTEPLPRASLEI